MDASDVGNDVSVASAKPEMHTQAHTPKHTHPNTHTITHAPLTWAAFKLANKGVRVEKPSTASICLFAQLWLKYFIAF